MVNKISCLLLVLHLAQALVQGGAKLGEYDSFWPLKTIDRADHCKWTQLKACFYNKSNWVLRDLTFFEMYFDKCEKITAKLDDFDESKVVCSKLGFKEGTVTHVQRYGKTDNDILGIILYTDKG